MIITGSFAATSRYAKSAINTYVDAQGNAISYVARRFVPSPDGFALLQTYTVITGDRIDNLAATFLLDPEQYWRLCDANTAMEPEALMVLGSELRITMPAGVPAPTRSNAK